MPLKTNSNALSGIMKSPPLFRALATASPYWSTFCDMFRSPMMLTIHEGLHYRAWEAKELMKGSNEDAV